jgi:hypothetical protein
LEILKLCRQAGMVKLGRVGLDGSKVRANASRRKAMSYKRMTEREADLQAEVDDLLRDAEATDTAEDDKFGPDGRDDDLEGEMARRESRLAKIRRAKADLEADAARRAAADAARKTWHKTAGGDDATAERRYDDTAGAAEEAAAEATVPDKAQRNFTDPDSRIMKTSDGSFHYCYNAQTAADEANQVIVATRLSNRSADCPEFVSLLDDVTANCGTPPGQVVADAGYFSEDNVAAADQRGVDALIATGRLKHDEKPAAAPRGRIANNATVKQRMARKLRTKPGRVSYARRKAIIEPVFGQIDTVRAANRSYSEANKPPPRNGGSSPRATTSASCSTTPPQPDRPPPEPPKRAGNPSEGDPAPRSALQPGPPPTAPRPSHQQRRHHHHHHHHHHHRPASPHQPNFPLPTHAPRSVSR